VGTTPAPVAKTSQPTVPLDRPQPQLPQLKRANLDVNRFNQPTTTPIPA
jgi:hypothetical protein